MGYAGYSPGLNSRTSDALTEYERALRQLPADKAAETLEILEKLTRNIVRSPKELKFRKIKLTNKKIAETITDVAGAMDILRTAGWVEGEDEEATLVLPASAQLTFETHVVKIIEARDFYKKELENQKRRQHREERDASDPAKAALLLQLQQDAQERATRGPAQASVAQQLGHGTVCRASDIGIGVSRGG